METSGRSASAILTVPAAISSLSLASNNPNLAQIGPADGSPAGYTTSPPATVYGAAPTYHIPSNDPRYPSTAPTPISVPYGTVAASGNPALGVTTAPVSAPHWATAAPPWTGDNTPVPSYPPTSNPNPEPATSVVPLAAIGLGLLALWCFA